MRILLPGGANSKLSSSKISSSSFDQSTACYAINVTATDIPSAKKSTCELALGVFAGFSAGGTEISLEVPRGSNRKLELFLYNRSSASDSCLPPAEAFSPANIVKVARGAEVSSFEMNEDRTLDVIIDPPAAGVSVVSQYSLPATCVAAAPTPVPSARPTGDAHDMQSTTSGGYKIRSSFGPSEQNTFVTNGGYKVRPYVRKQ